MRFRDKNASIKNENRQLLKGDRVLKEELAMRQAIYLNQVAQNASSGGSWSIRSTRRTCAGATGRLEELRVMADLPLHEDLTDEEPVVEVVDQRPGFFGRLFVVKKRSGSGTRRSRDKVGPTEARSSALSRTIDASTTFETVFVVGN